MKKILGLDLGTNSIAWALVEQDFPNKHGKILGMGTRIIPMSQDILGEFGKGNSVSQTAERTRYRSSRRLRERHLLRRQRLHRVLHVLDFLPQHYVADIDFEKRLGQFKVETEPKLAYDKSRQFIFKKSFAEMLAEFQQHNPQFLTKQDGSPALVPYDWTLYYLRKKALTQKIEKEELAWILLNFNQKRGYYQLRGEEEEENPNKLVEYHSLKVTEVIADEQTNTKGEQWYSIKLENGWTYRRSSKNALTNWVGKYRDFIVTTDLNNDGTVKTDKEGNVKRSFRAPGEEDWTLLKKKTEQEIEKSNKTIGTFIYDTLLQNPKQKIKGKLIRTIERKFYKDELRQILKTQINFHPELQSEDLYTDCVRELYRTNESHQLQLSKKGFEHLFLDDIIFYQRPLRSQKSGISNCPLEYRKFRDQEGVEQVHHLKAIPKSNPYFQEFRLWQWIHNLSIYNKENDQNVTHEFFSQVQDWEKLFEFLNKRKEVDQKALIRYCLESRELKGKALNAAIEQYYWNYVPDKSYPCNETRASIQSRLEKLIDSADSFLTKEVELQLWHIIYSVTEKADYEKALATFAHKYGLDSESFLNAFKKFAPFNRDYGSFSEKAIKKLLPLLRLGKYWSWNNIDDKSRQRVEKIIDGEYDDNIKERVRQKTIHLSKEEHFQGLQLWLAQYIVYDRHSEANSTKKWNSVDDLKKHLEEFRQHSLRNPIVEQVVTETLRVVRDIWIHYGKGEKDFIDEIHIELGREMKLPAEERKRITHQITENENTNLRIKALLAEMKNDAAVENVRPYSPMQQEILKIYEDTVLNSGIEIEADILKISQTAQPSPADLRRYKLWLEQKYRSPYTGEIIPLNKLFTADYEIEHIIPQALYFDDSFSNKVICESAVNKLKDNDLGYTFIKRFGGTTVECGMGKTVKILQQAAYEDFVKQHYAKNRLKRSKLLLEEIPEKMIERQMNDTRYISKYMYHVLSSIVRLEDGTDEGINSKNIVPGNGKITTQLKQHWGLTDIWNDLILPRFHRLNQLHQVTHFTAWSETHQKWLPAVPIEASKGFSRKRIDHRHHALDALVIACATRDHVNLLNNQAAKSANIRYDLKRKLMKFENESWTDPRTGENIRREVPKQFFKPWETFTADARNFLERMVVSFKQNLRVINKATNYYEKYVIKDGMLLKEKVMQQGSNWAIRKSLHKETISGYVNLPWVKVPKGKILTATRKAVDQSFDLKKIESITDTGIQKILKNYLEAKGGNPEIAFSPEGMEDLNNNIAQYNEGKRHQPIHKVRLFELGSKFQVGTTGNKKLKYAEADKGTNLFFGIYVDENGKRTYNAIPFNEVVERLKQGLPAVPVKNDKNHKLIFNLSPNDLVYISNEDEKINADLNTQLLFNKDQIKRIYKFVSCTGGEAHFIPFGNASEIVKNENGTNSKSERMQDYFDGNCIFDASGKPLMIKENCLKLSINRLGFFCSTDK